MTAALRSQEWVSFIERTYLNDFIAKGGASIKFAVSLDDTGPQEALELVRSTAIEQSYLPVEVDASVTRFHMIDQVFFRIAEQVPWQDLARSFVRMQAAQAAYQLCKESDQPSAEAIAEVNDTDAGIVLNELRRRLSKTVYKDAALAKDFRVAMMSLCMAELVGGQEGAVQSSAITEWLTGQNRAVSAVKPYGIFSRISRNNARFLLESLFVWVRMNELNGTVVLFNTQRLTVLRRPPDGVFYTRPALLDSYEVLRQFIDSTDRLVGCLLVIFPAQEFLETEPGTRGIGLYQALKARVYDEVHDKRLVNPMASLVRLDGGELVEVART